MYGELTMTRRDGNKLASQSKETCRIAKPAVKEEISPLRQGMIRDMELAGLVHGTQQTYIRAVAKLQDHYGIRPDKLSEKQVSIGRSSHVRKSASPYANDYRYPLPGKTGTG
jgi:hypothetical protein